MSDEELRAVELDENVEREALTDYDTTQQRLAEIRQVEAQLKAKAEANTSVHQPKKSPKRGQPRKAESRANTAAETGTGERTRRKMEQQVELAERFPFLQRPGFLLGEVQPCGMVRHGS